MKRINVYAVIREMREQVVKTMQERGIKSLSLCMGREEWLKLNPDKYEEDYDTYESEAPYAVFFDKYGCGYDYRVDSVTLKTREYDNEPVLEFDCYANEIGSETFVEDDMVFLTLYNIYDALMDLLVIESEPEYVWVFTAEQAWDDEVADVIVKTFRKKETAQEFMHKFIHDGGEESIEDYVKRKGWEVELDEPDLYRAYGCRYSTDHIEITITECNIE